MTEGAEGFSPLKERERLVASGRLFPSPPHSRYDGGILPWRRFVLLRRVGSAVLLASLLPAVAFAHKEKPCVTAEEAVKMLHKDVCVTAHIYDVVQLPDGTRFLDVCSPQITDQACRFTIVSPSEDRDTVGALNKYRDTDVRIRGIVEPMHGRAGMVLSHIRQFSGGPPRFRPNPLLARGFNAEEDRPPLYDPNLRSQGAGRSFMNSRDQEARPGK